ncbi:MAG: hypothetical protein JNM07_13800 [Phycisphaerae bacterium]|nr:hypothetical protein [Phycisphaerae bacterium]
MDETLLPAGWTRAVRDPRLAAEIDAVYARAASAIERRGPACWASGRCCRFRDAGHRLYVTGLEAALTLVRLDRSPLAPAELESAIARGTCVFVSGNLCSVHTIKPLGCRLYFCDRSAAAWQREVHEQLLSDIRDIHDRHQQPYRYGEWGDMLRRFIDPSPTVGA